MKKNIVLFVLFILPIVAYLFFASGVNSFTKLPILTKNIPDFSPEWKMIDGKPAALKNKITILAFGGFEILKNRGNLYNLNSKIYDKYSEFKDLQFVVLSPIGTETDVKKIIEALKTTGDISKWQFVFAKADEIKTYYNELKLKKDQLNADFGTPKIYLVDKLLNLRGRKVNDEKEYKEGYNTFHPSEISNEMTDDFKILLYEYRAALKKNKNATRKI
jgi:hypothetical protein